MPTPASLLSRSYEYLRTKRIENDGPFFEIGESVPSVRYL